MVYGSRWRRHIRDGDPHYQAVDRWLGNQMFVSRLHTGGMAMIDFTDQVAIVTGAGRGLGRLYALELARRGASVIVNDLGGTMHGEGADTTVADEVVAEIEGAGGVAVASHDSVASAQGGEAIVELAVERFGRLDAVVSNAGIFNSIAFDEISADDWRRMLSVHLDGGFYLS